MKKIAIVGTRSRNTSAAFDSITEQFWKIYEEGDWIISGGCKKGGDRCAEAIAKAEGIPILIIYPCYKKFKLGAPTVRNGPVAKNSDVVIACVRRPEEGLEEVLKRKKGGTEDMLKKFVKEHPEGKVFLV
jgi:hypothetical protein